MAIAKHELNTKLLELLPDPSGKKENLYYAKSKITAICQYRTINETINC